MKALGFLLSLPFRLIGWVIGTVVKGGLLFVGVLIVVILLIVWAL